MKNKGIKKFNELMTPEETFNLGLYPFLKNKDDEDYFFNSKTINRIYDEDVIKVQVYELRCEGDELIFRTKITINKSSFDIYIITDFDNNVHFGSSKGKNYIDSFEKALRPEFEYFMDMFEDIYRDMIPHDFWEVKSKVN